MNTLIRSKPALAVVGALALVLALGAWLLVSREDGEDGAVPISWMKSQSLAYTGNELPRPFSRYVQDTDDLWQVYEVKGSSEPTLLYEGDRLLSNPQLQADGTLLMDIASRRAGDDAHQFLNGHLAIEASSAAVRSLVLYPTGTHTASSPDKSHTVIQVSDGASARVFVQKAGDDEPLQLVGLGEHVQFASWSPEGHQMLVSTLQPLDPSTGSSRPERTYYLVSPGSKQARPVATTRIGHPSWAPDGTAIAFFPAEDTSIPFTDTTTLKILDLHTGEHSEIVLNRVFSSSVITWSADGTLITTGRGIIDVARSEVIIQPESDQHALLSPDKRSLAWSDGAPGTPANGCPQPFQQLRTMLLDISSQEETLLLPCDQGILSVHDWLDDDTLIVMGGRCMACDGNVGNQVVLVDTADGRMQLLTEGIETAAWITVSEDRQQLLVTGNRLRLYSSDGVLLREIEPPPGSHVLSAAWSEDGSSIVYIIGPVLVGVL